ncbi:MAG: hypothetical protein QNJ22_05415 [Desulfosarcinaceae bacterium]|nr:hypothetical protein [Desulfosarcinaceae bacterium]
MPSLTSFIAHIRHLSMVSPWLCFLVACAVVEPNPICFQDGRPITVAPYIALGKADEYYERGRAYSAHSGCLDLAARDFEQALQRRNTDQWRLRIRGDWPLDYFPNRELGIVYYHKGWYSQAEAALLVSLHNAHSDRAVYYLEQTRKAIVAERGTSREGPAIRLAGGAATRWTNDMLVVVEGMVEDSNFIAQLSIGGESMYLFGNPASHRFRKVFPGLPQGHHTIAIRAVNLNGHESHMTANIHVDHQGPTIDLQPLRPSPSANQEQFVLTTTLRDAAGLDSLDINGQLAARLAGERQTIAQTLSAGAFPLTLTARDRLGNQTRMQVPLPAFRAALSARRVYIASRSAAGLVSASASATSSEAIQMELVDYLQDVGADTLTVYQDRILVPIEMSAGSEGIQSARMTVTESCLEPSIGTSCRTQSVSRTLPVHGQLKTGTRRVDIPLSLKKAPCCKVGRHDISIEVFGESGRTLRRRIRLNSRVPKALDFSDRILIRLVDTSTDRTTFIDHLETALLGTGRFLVEVNPAGATGPDSSPWELSHFTFRDYAGDTEYSAVLSGRFHVKGRSVRIRCGSPSLFMLGAQEKPREIRSAARLFAQRILLEFPLLQGKITATQQAGQLYEADIAYVRQLAGRKLHILPQLAKQDPTVFAEPIALGLIERIDLSSAKIRILDTLKSDRSITNDDWVVSNYY